MVRRCTLLPRHVLRSPIRSMRSAHCRFGWQPSTSAAASAARGRSSYTSLFVGCGGDGGRGGRRQCLPGRRGVAFVVGGGRFAAASSPASRRSSRAGRSAPSPAVARAAPLGASLPAPALARRPDLHAHLGGRGLARTLARVRLHAASLAADDQPAVHAAQERALVDAPEPQRGPFARGAPGGGIHCGIA